MRTVSIPTSAGEAATHGGTNAMVAIVLAAYLAIVLYQGNLGNLATAARQDFLGGNGEPPFWRWAAALLVLMALARSPKLNFLFGPALAFTLIAMLINVASKQPEAFKNLNNGVRGFFGYPTTGTPSLAAPTGAATNG